MIRKLAQLAVLAAIAGGLVFWFLTMPERVDAASVASMPPGDAEAGRLVFHQPGCSSCHARPEAKGDDKLLLAGGHRFATAFGTFVAPNISSDKTAGIGGWTLEQFATALTKGVSPDGRHYYPAFPFTSYARMTPKDVSDLFVYMQTLPAVSEAAPPHEVGFPFNIRRGLGLWKLLFLKDGPVETLPADASDALKRGQYLVEGPGHCGECHTPRNAIGGLQLADWLEGAVAAEGEGKVPNISQGEGGISGWSEKDIAYYLESGFTPEFDSVGGSMVAVQENMSKLPASDREAIAAYLKTVKGD